VPEALASTSVYMLEVDSDNGDIYVGTSDYYSNGVIYRFDKNGNLRDTFESGGVSPRKAVFIH
jgi:DNA-binding beta-propeller fold protein YncE